MRYLLGIMTLCMACGTGTEGDAGERLDPTQRMCQRFVDEYNNGPCADIDTIREDQCADEDHETCPREGMWRCLRETTDCIRNAGTGEYERWRLEDYECPRECEVDGGV